MPHSPRFVFDLLVNIPETAPGPAQGKRRPRIIYVRDYPTLSSSLREWWPQLQSAVQLRRRTASTSTDAPVENRTVLIVGATPTGTSALRYYDNDVAEEDSNREETLCKTLKKWAAGNGDPLDEVTCLRSDTFRSALRSGRAGKVFLRKSFLVPTTRAPEREKMTRIARRQEINMLMMRSTAASCGAILPDVYSTQEGDAMWDEWGKRRLSLQMMHTIVGHAVGNAEVAAMERVLEDGLDDEWSAPLSLSWDEIRSKWSAQRTLRDKRPSWTQTTEVEDKEDKKSEEDDVVKRVKNAGDLSGYERSQLACIVDLASMTTSFDDVLLPPETIDAVRTVASLHLLQPGAFEQGILKQYSMKGLLLFGPPGVGKTHVVRALAKECGARMLSVQPSHITQKYMGEDEKHVRAVFSLARRLSPCVVFIDELDAMFPERAAYPSPAANAYRAIVTEFLQEMDGILSKQDNVIVVGATNRPFDLDDAILRRLPLRIMVELPGESQREGKVFSHILRIHLRDELLDDDVDVKRLAKLTDRFSGSDLKHLVVSAALDATKESVELPWRRTAKPLAEDAQSSSALPASTEILETAPEPTQTQDDILTAPSKSEPCKRVLRWRNFAQALTEIWPSASEHLGTYAKLRDWNDKFGSGGRKRDKDDVKDPEAGDHEGALAKVKRAFDLSDTERLLLKCAVDPGAPLLVSYT
ncbi:P-loop containing nucleoside triphosphate hydrolase protein [Vararia minispora EC-137]|uniref:P-loop containing nucleoside triphosphate hydrolase protein n=1 Tax=Vararia minispora EC-137 TaxID=1314806 RepID=A0ACB8Q5Z9_9AGAM|nr:P-loop containing nucleoside triphosphate hydrolase protein [Vararia minispora EC-137]